MFWFLCYRFLFSNGGEDCTEQEKCDKIREYNSRFIVAGLLEYSNRIQEESFHLVNNGVNHTLV